MDRVQQVPWDEVSQDLIRFWSYFGLFCIASVLCSKARVRYFSFAQQCLTKKLEGKAVDRFLFLFGFYTEQTVNSAANVVFTSKIGLPCVVPVLWWVSFVRQIVVPPRSEFEQHMNSSDPRPDSVSFMQLESRRAVPGFHGIRTIRPSAICTVAILGETLSPYAVGEP